MGAPAMRVKGTLVGKGWTVNQDGLLCTELGDGIAQRKVWSLAWRGHAAQTDKGFL